jgi:hypothetical protein
MIARRSQLTGNATAAAAPAGADPARGTTAATRISVACRELHDRALVLERMKVREILRASP